MNRIKNRIYVRIFIGATLLLLVACDNDHKMGSHNLDAMPVPAAPERQQDPAQLAMGKQVFQNNCASCHGGQAEGAANWRKKDMDGFYPAPPLNGSGHAWHHSTEVLGNVISNGSVQGQGKMPAWKGKLSGQEISAVIVWFQSTWPQSVYDAWFEMQQRGR